MKKINIIGFGKMGMQITSLLMIMGYQVNIFTKNFSLREKKFNISNKIFEKFFKIKQSGSFKIYENIRDLPKNHTIETLLEDLTVKKNMLSKLNYEFNDIFLFTNTSSYNPKEINNNAYGIHFFNPIHQIKVIETTCSQNLMEDSAKFFFDDLKKFDFKIFKVKNNRGYVYNFLYFKRIALCYELMEKYEYKSNEIIEILNAFKTNNNFEEIINLVGKDTTKKILKNLLENQNDNNNIKKNF